MKLKELLLAGLLLLGAVACNDEDETPVFPEAPVYDMSGFEVSVSIPPMGAIPSA